MRDTPGLAARGFVVDHDWSSVRPSRLLGTTPPSLLPSGAGNASSSSMAAATGAAAEEGMFSAPWHPDSPLFWFGVLTAVTLGLIGVTVTGRAGPIRGEFSADRKRKG